MNVFVLPSWYPSRAQPMAGLFVRDQARALAAARPAWQVVVGGWGHHDGALDLRDAGASLRALRWRWRARAGWVQGAERPQELLTPRLSWTLALAGGGARGLLSASRDNLQRASERHGCFDILHAHVGFPAGWIAARLAAETGARVVLTEHMGPFPFAALRDHDGSPNAALHEAYGAAAATVAVSRALADQIRAAGLPCSDVIPNVVDEQRFVLAPPPPGPFTLLALARLLPSKGLDVLLQAFALMARRDARLTIGGSGPQGAALPALAQRLGVADRVRFIGAVAPADVPALHAASHAVVLASQAETFGVVLAEALMCGRPVVATRCGGPVGIVHDGNGLLVPPGDAGALAAALDRIASDHARYDPAALRADAVARFGAPAVGGALARLCERVAA